jgi:uncharacterized protein (DUF488 family)
VTIESPGKTREDSGPNMLSVGHSTLRPDEFVALLTGAGVELVADVRRHPGSRRVPWTNAGRVEAELARGSIRYLHLPGLGGRRRPSANSPNEGWENAQFRGYADHMGSGDFAAALRELESHARRSRTVVMCAEALWWRCHRRLLADALLVRGWRVFHLDSRGGQEPHALTTFAVADGTDLSYPR